MTTGTGKELTEQREQSQTSLASAELRGKKTSSQRKETKDLNRIKVMLAEKKRTNKWLAEQLGKDPATVSKWCTNSTQPTLETLIEIAKVLDVELAELVRMK